MKRYTIRDTLYECRMLDCKMEDFLYDFGLDVDSISFCDYCPCMKAINRLAVLEDMVEPFLDNDVQFEHG